MSASVELLNHSFAIPGRITFEEGPAGLPVSRLTATGGEAVVALGGAHLISWQPKGGEPVLWLSKSARFAPGRSIRGGTPICWPWFGPHDTEMAWPAHGFARTLPWHVEKTEAITDERICICLSLDPNENVRLQWPYPFMLQSIITLSQELRVDLVTRNAGSSPFVIGEALHTYFAVSDVRKIHVRGLDGCEYIDKADAGTRKVQKGAITIGSEVDRVYLNTREDCVIADRGLNRCIRVRKEGSLSTVVWNPWVEKAERMGDLGPEGYLGMVCVETANALENRVTVHPGEEHVLTACYSLEPFAAED